MTTCPIEIRDVGTLQVVIQGATTVEVLRPPELIVASAAPEVIEIIERGLTGNPGPPGQSGEIARVIEIDMTGPRFFYARTAVDIRRIDASTSPMTVGKSLQSDTAAAWPGRAGLAYI